MENAHSGALVKPVLQGLGVVLVASFVHAGTPWIAEAFYELYHLTKIEAVYPLYGVARYLSAYFMLWQERWIVTLLVMIAGISLIAWRQFRNGVRK